VPIAWSRSIGTLAALPCGAATRAALRATRLLRSINAIA
jgi:hypothetical protein